MKNTTIGRTQYVTLDVAGPPVQTPQGGYTETWLPLEPAAWYCEILPSGTDTERAIAGTLSATATHELRGRFHPELDVQTRVTLIDRHRGGVTRRFMVESVRARGERGVELSAIAHELIDAPAAVTR
jgi:Phage head-tail joining protein